MTQPLVAGASHLWSRLALSVPGCWVALLLALLSFLPSLIPRPSLYQGALAGVSAAIGYGLGVLGAWLWHALADREPRPPTVRHLRALAVVASGARYVPGRRSPPRVPDRPT